jgi:autotransporter adhesin
MVQVALRRRLAPSVLAAATFAGGMMIAPARAEDHWLIRMAASLIAPSSDDPLVSGGVNSFAFGQYAVASGENSMAFGYTSLASGANAMALGPYSAATGDNAMALGVSSQAAGDNSTGIGSFSNASGDNAVAVGISSTASGANTSAIGNGSLAAGDNSVAVGVQAQASGANTTALGNHAKATGDNSVALGVLSDASGDNATAFGNHSKASGINSTAVGILSKAAGANAIALGNQARAIGNETTAIGTQALATGDNSMAIGIQAKARGDNSIAIGNGSVAGAPNTVSFGSPDAERRLTHIADGIAPTDAATVGQLDSLRSWFNQRITAILKKISAISKLRPTPPPPARVAGVSAPAPARPTAAATHKAANGDATTAGRAEPQAVRNEQKSAAVRSAQPPGQTRLQPKAAVSRKAVAGRGRLEAPPPKAARNSKVASVRMSDRDRSHVGEMGTASLSTSPRVRPNSSGPNLAQPPADIVSSQRFEAGMASLNARIDDVDTHARRGIAAATALAPVMIPSRPGKTTVSLGGGHYRGETALSVSIAHSFDASMPVVVYGGYANAAGVEHVGRVGVAVEF